MTQLEKNYPEGVLKRSEIISNKFCPANRNNYVMDEIGDIYNVHVYPEGYGVRFQVKKYDPDYEMVCQLFGKGGQS